MGLKWAKNATVCLIENLSKSVFLQGLRASHEYPTNFTYLVVSETYIKPSHYHKHLFYPFFVAYQQRNIHGNLLKFRDKILISLKHHCHGNSMSEKYQRSLLSVLGLSVNTYLEYSSNTANEINASCHYLLITPRSSGDLLQH